MEPIASSKKTLRGHLYEPMYIVGERRICWARIILSSILIFFIHALALGSPLLSVSTFAASITGSLTFIAISIFFLVLIRVDRFAPWMVFLSAGTDLVLVTILFANSTLSDPLRTFTTSSPYIYFVIIALAALRHSPTLVAVIGASSAVAYLTTMGFIYLHYISGWRAYIKSGDEVMMGLHFIDEFSKAIAMLVLGWLISHVSRNLINSQRHYKDLFEQIPDGILITSPDDRIETVNPRLADMIGVPQKDLIGREFAGLLSVKTPGPRLPGSDPLSIVGDSLALRHVDGTEISVMTATTSMERKGESYSVMSIRDVTEEVRLENQLARSQGMEAFGQFAGGIAHDLNNILGGILGASALSKRFAIHLEEGDRERIEQRFDVILKCSEDARNMIATLMTYSRVSSLETSVVNLLEVISGVSSICTRTFGEEYQISTSELPPEATTLGDSGALSQALLNICLNAKDAMPGGGRIKFSLHEEFPDNGLIERHPEAVPECGYWCIGLSDTGVGMTQDKLEKLLAPFLTNMPFGEGTGLGLPMAYSILVKHNGFFDVSSAPGEGTTFRVFLPTYTATAPIARTS